MNQTKLATTDRSSKIRLRSAKCAKIALFFAIFSGCSDQPATTPQTVSTAAEQKKEMSPTEYMQDRARRLKEQNDYKAAFISLHDELQEEADLRKDDSSSRLTDAITAIETQEQIIKERDGELASCKFIYEQLIGKTLDEVLSKWAPRDKQ